MSLTETFAPIAQAQRDLPAMAPMLETWRWLGEAQDDLVHWHAERDRAVAIVADALVAADLIGVAAPTRSDAPLAARAGGFDGRLVPRADPVAELADAIAARLYQVDQTVDALAQEFRPQLEALGFLRSRLLGQDGAPPLPGVLCHVRV